MGLVVILFFLSCTRAAVFSVTPADMPTLQTTVRALQAGDTIEFTGVFQNVNFVLSRDGLAGGPAISGSAGNPITFRGLGNAELVSDTTSNGQSLGTFNIMNGAQWSSVPRL